MKKFLNTMLVTAAVVSAASVASAASAGKVAQGAYVGASAGAANTNVKYNMVTQNPVVPAGSTSSAETKAYNINAGKTAGLFGLIGGYNFQSGSFVFGGEIYGGLDSAKVTVLDDTVSGNSTELSTAGALTVKRTNFFGFAPRLGFMVAPNTLMYARMGVEFGKWKATVNPNQNMIGKAGVGVPSLDNQNASKAVVNTSKGGMSFAPGLGMEVYMGKAFLRAQYSYLFGPKISLQQNMKGYDTTFFNGDYANHSMKINQHKVELAVGYKF